MRLGVEADDSWEGEEFVLSFSIARANCVVTLGNSVVPRVKAFAREKMPHCAYGDMVLVASRTSEANRTTIMSRKKASQHIFALLGKTSDMYS